MGANMRSGEWLLKPPVTKTIVWIKATARKKSAARISGGPPRQPAWAMAGIQERGESTLKKICCNVT